MTGIHIQRLKQPKSGGWKEKTLKIQKMLEESSLTTACVQKTAENKCGNTGGEYEGGNLDCNM